MAYQRIHKRWIQQASAQLRQQIPGYQPHTQKALSPVSQQLSMTTSAAKAAQYFAMRGCGKRGCCR
ncbi:MAG: hypothetical protein GX228_05280 [Firmicutes bacterium]|nr:hypothetical protein [Bacillota bacterium]NLL88335.1 hypothetical protein [Bacillota bacterium]HKM17746.1 hypothetical protein [Limnochordia bacterium]